MGKKNGNYPILGQDHWNYPEQKSKKYSDKPPWPGHPVRTLTPAVQSVMASPALAGEAGGSPLAALRSASAIRSWPPANDLQRSRHYRRFSLQVATIDSSIHSFLMLNNVTLSMVYWGQSIFNYWVGRPLVPKVFCNILSESSPSLLG